MVPSDAGHAIDQLRKHLTGATRLDSLSESFSLFVYEALQDELTDVDLRLLLHGHSLEHFPSTASRRKTSSGHDWTSTASPAHS